MKHLAGKNSTLQSRCVRLEKRGRCIKLSDLCESGRQICAKKGIYFVPVLPVVSCSQLLDLLEYLAPYWTLLDPTTNKPFNPNTEEHLKSNIQQVA